MLNAMLSGARDTAWTATPLQANHSRFLASARTKVGQVWPTLRLLKRYNGVIERCLREPAVSSHGIQACSICVLEFVVCHAARIVGTAHAEIEKTSQGR